MMQSTFVTIIIPTYKDWHRLAICVTALENQTYPKENFEVIIVNNDAGDNTPGHFNVPERFQVVTEKQSGSYAARNRGLGLAKGEIIGFTDSDCIPDPDWIAKAVEYFHTNENCSRIAGKVEVFAKTGKPTTAEIYDQLYAFRQKRYVQDSGTCVTANLFSYKHVFDTVGLFDQVHYSLSDVEWGKEANKAGFRIDYVENVIVKHPARNWDELVKKEKRLGGGIGLRLRGKQRFNLIKFLNEYRPRLAEFKHVFSDGKHLNSIDKMKVLVLRHYLLGIRAYERTRVMLGKDPNRA
jgi:glycosyltransferase involved in cell wall biosynthesis